MKPIAALLAELAAADRAYNKAVVRCQLRGAEILKEARHTLRLTQRDMAERIGVSVAHLCRMEKGRLPVGVPTLLKVHRALKTKGD